MAINQNYTTYYRVSRYAIAQLILFEFLVNYVPVEHIFYCLLRYSDPFAMRIVSF